jgi:hypothetical protein
MDIFCLSSALGMKSLVEYHFWKYEFKMEALELYSTFMTNAHVVIAIHSTSNLLCFYSSVCKYKLHSHNNIRIVPKHSLGNGVFSLSANIVDIDEKTFEDEDTIYDCYDSNSLTCKPSHHLYFNQRILFQYDWSSLILNFDFKLLCLDDQTYKEPFYLINSSSYQQLLCKMKTSLPCKHSGKRICNISGGYKQLNFDLQTDTSLACPCSIFSYLNKEFNGFHFNYVLLSYKVTQLVLNF